MNKLMNSAQLQVSSQLSSKDNDLFHVEKLKRIVVTGLVTTAIALTGMGIGVKDAQATDTSTYTKVLGGTLGALVGNKLTSHSDSNTRAAATVIGATIGTWGGDAAGTAMENRNNQNYNQNNNQYRESASEYNQRMDQMAQQRAADQQRFYDNQRQQQQQMQQQQQYQRTTFVSVEQTRPVPTRQSSGWVEQQQGSERGNGPSVYDPEAMGMPDVVAKSLAATQTGLVASGSRSLSNYPTGAEKLTQATDSLIVSGRAYNAASEAMDRAQLESGTDGVNARTKSAQALAGATKALQSKVQEWGRVRNILGSQNYDISASDDAVRVNLRDLHEQKQYNFQVNTRNTYTR